MLFTATSPATEPPALSDVSETVPLMNIPRHRRISVSDKNVHSTLTVRRMSLPSFLVGGITSNDAARSENRVERQVPTYFLYILAFSNHIIISWYNCTLNYNSPMISNFNSRL